MEWDKNKYLDIIKNTRTIKEIGRITEIIGLTIESDGPKSSIGDLCHIYNDFGDKPTMAEVVGFKKDKILLMPLASPDGIRPGAFVVNTGGAMKIGVGNQLIGRVLDGLGNPIDTLGDIQFTDFRSTRAAAINPLKRKRISEPLSLGIRAIDGFATVGKGQRMGIFAGSGVGKSTLLGMIARNSDADVNVVALIGERGREVKEFVEDALGPEGMAKSVLVCSTGDKPPLIRQKCLLTATAVCEYFRDRGQKVFLMTDTVTRCAMAGREVGLSLGEPPTMKGYPPSIFSWLQKVLERAGNSEKGSITALYTVLMEGDDINDPIVDIVRGIVDGHIFLSRKVAESNHYPAIDVLGSISRLMSAIATPEHKQAAAKLRTIMSLYRENKDLIDVGMYQPGSNPRLDTAIEMMPKINAFLQQRTDDSVTMDGTISQLIDMMKDVEI